MAVLPACEAVPVRVWCWQQQGKVAIAYDRSYRNRGTLGKDNSLNWGLCPQTPRIYRFAARMARFFGGRLAPPRPFRPLSRRSGRIPALPLRSSQCSSTLTNVANFSLLWQLEPAITNSVLPGSIGRF